MPKPNAFHTLYDTLKTLSISFLKKHGYLNPYQNQNGIVTWSNNGVKTGSISIRVIAQPESPYLVLDYKCNEVPINYRVQLVSAPSNLGKGVVWYFICPHTGKRCRKLYLANTYFFHRLAFKGCFYEKQTQSKKTRQLYKNLDTYFQRDQLFEQLNKKHFKRHYAGKPTSKYLKLTQKVQKLKRDSHHLIEWALLS